MISLLDLTYSIDSRLSIPVRNTAPPPVEGHTVRMSGAPDLLTERGLVRDEGEKGFRLGDDQRGGQEQQQKVGDARGTSRDHCGSETVHWTRWDDFRN